MPSNNGKWTWHSPYTYTTSTSGTGTFIMQVATRHPPRRPDPPTCKACGSFEDECICEACPDCDEIGDIRCYQAGQLVGCGDDCVED